MDDDGVGKIGRACSERERREGEEEEEAKTEVGGMIVLNQRQATPQLQMLSFGAVLLARPVGRNER